MGKDPTCAVQLMGQLDPSKGLGETRMTTNTFAITANTLVFFKAHLNCDIVQVHVGRAALNTPTDADILLPLAGLAPRQAVCGFLATYLELLPRVLPRHAVAFPTRRRSGRPRCAAQHLPAMRLPLVQTASGSLAVQSATCPPRFPSPSVTAPLCAVPVVPARRPLMPAALLSLRLQLNLPLLSFILLSFSIPFSKKMIHFLGKRTSVSHSPQFFTSRGFFYCLMDPFTVLRKFYSLKDSLFCAFFCGNPHFLEKWPFPQNN